MNEPYAEIIMKFPLFQGYTLHGARSLLEQGEIREHEPGEVICHEGDPPTFVLLMLAGKVQVFVERRGRVLVLQETGPGTLLGELAVLCGIPRSASLRATEKVVALHWRKESFRRILLGNSFLSEQILSQSLRTLIDKERALIDSLTAPAGPQVQFA